jgi:hypothetical protein
LRLLYFIVLQTPVVLGSVGDAGGKLMLVSCCCFQYLIIREWVVLDALNFCGNKCFDAWGKLQAPFGKMKDLWLI